MHPLTRLFNYLQRKNFALVLAREHVGYRELPESFPDWFYEVMETDEGRNQPYRETIRETVAGKVVVELGTGPKALWAVYCVRAGAKRVYAIEANKAAYQSSLDYVTSQNIDNVHLICGFSDQIQLPERCDVLVHELVGEIGSAEGMIPFIEDTRKRLLKPGAIHIPQRCTTYFVLAEDPKLHLAEWALSYGLRGFRRFEDQSFVRFSGFPQSAALSEPQVFEDFIFPEALQLQTDQRVVVEIQRDGELRGFVFFIRLHLSETRVIDTWTSRTGWSTPYVRFKAATPVRKGDLIEMRIQSDVSSNPSYSVKLSHTVDGSPIEIGQYVWTGD